MKKVLALMFVIGCFIFAYADIPDPPDQIQIENNLQETYTNPVIESDFYVYDAKFILVDAWIFENYTQPYPVIKKIGEPLPPNKTNEFGLLISINRLC